MGRKIVTELDIYTDASTEGSKSKNGGVAFVVCRDGAPICMESMYMAGGDNSRLELSAACAAIKWCTDQGYLINKRKRIKKLNIYSDAKYVTNSIRYVETWKKDGTWDGRPNKDLLEYIYKWSKFIKFTWVRGHRGNKYNEVADFMARTTRKTKENFIINDG